MNKTIEYKGIQRHTSDINCADGACEEIINLRNKNGKWIPVGKKIESTLNIPTIGSTKILYRHPVNDENLIFYDYGKLDTYSYLYLIEQDGASYNPVNILTITNADETVQSISHLNNFLIVTTDKTRYFLFWDYDNEEYVELEDIPMPLMHFEKNIVESGSWLGTELFEHQHLVDATNGSEFANSVSTCADQIKDAYTALRVKYAEKGLVSGYTLIRFAYKLYDGTYIKHSAPFFIAITDKSLQLLASAFDGGVGWKYCYRWNLWYGSFGNLKYIYNFTTAHKNILEKYSGIIKSIDFFITNPLIEYDFSTDIIKGIDDGGLDIDINATYTGLNNSFDLYDNPYKNDILKEINYYKIDSISLEEILSDYAPTSLIDLDFSDIKNLLTKETLPVDNFTHHSIWGDSNYNYNSRLHFGNTTTKLFGGFNPFYWDYTSSNNSSYNYAVKTWIRTDQGDKIVTEYFDAPLTKASPTTLLSNTILCYPDSRAYKMRILQEDSGNPDDYYHDNYEFDLTPHPFLNLAYNIDAGLDNDYGYTIDQSTWTQSSLEDMTEDKYLTDENRVQVSKLDNPIVNLAENSYQIGASENEIIGLASVTEPLSEGQHGQYPLYVFTTQGIKALEQGDSGDILYKNIIDLSSEVCNNSDSITGIEGGVLFTTDKGLKIISGRKIEHLSLPAEGEPKTYLTSNNSYETYLDDEYLVELFDYVAQDDFLDYLEYAVIAYDHVNKEILVGSTLILNYMWVFNLESKTWTKRTDGVFSKVINNYPAYLGYNSATLYDLTREDDTQYVSTLIQSRPIKLDTNNRKRIDRIIQRCNLNVKDLTKAGFYVFGSIDGNSYKFMRGLQPDADGTYFDMLIRRITSSLKYIIVVFAGQLKDSEITALEVQFEEKYANKLR